MYPYGERHVKSKLVESKTNQQMQNDEGLVKTNPSPVFDSRMSRGQAIAAVAASVAGTALASFAFPGLHLLRDLHPFQLAHFLRAWL
jgi:hypothetical protein